MGTEPLALPFVLPARSRIQGSRPHGILPASGIAQLVAYGRKGHRHQPFPIPGVRPHHCRVWKPSFFLHAERRQRTATLLPVPEQLCPLHETTRQPPPVCHHYVYFRARAWHTTRTGRRLLRYPMDRQRMDTRTRRIRCRRTQLQQRLPTGGRRHKSPVDFTRDRTILGISGHERNRELYRHLGTAQPESHPKRPGKERACRQSRTLPASFRQICGTTLQRRNRTCHENTAIQRLSTAWPARFPGTRHGTRRSGQCILGIEETDR